MLRADQAEGLYQMIFARVYARVFVRIFSKDSLPESLPRFLGRPPHLTLPTASDLSQCSEQEV